LAKKVCVLHATGERSCQKSKKMGEKAMIPYRAGLLEVTTMLLLKVTGKEPYWFLFTR